MPTHERQMKPGQFVDATRLQPGDRLVFRIVSGPAPTGEDEAGIIDDVEYPFFSFTHWPAGRYQRDRCAVVVEHTLAEDA